MTGFLQTHGPRLAELGYDPVPIKIGTKRPVTNGWQNTDFGALLATPQGRRMFSGSGVGVKTRFTPAVDADSPSEWLIEKVYDWCVDNIGPTIARIGQPPRELFVYRAETPFRKVKSDTFISPDGNEHKVELLADGQQFVAYAIHPGTGKSYYWPDQELIDTPKPALSLITEKHGFALVDYVNRTCAAAGWARKVARQQSAERSPAADPHAPLPLLTAAMSVMSIYPETYDRWIAVGAALYHATDGSAEGLELWDKWSKKSDTYDGATHSKWETFGSRPGAGAGTVFYWAEKSSPGWRGRPDIAAMFAASRAAPSMQQTITHKVLIDKLWALMNRIRNSKDQDHAW
ncbi:PriCT-2 domain-containing protein [Mesorhizobium shangrilense]|uniref:PriCT-2 domain-containing protein n=1 Tax=Mesorhizobium shangrilense TaxID=460060 RepID=A0ABV2D794_9HYPH